MKRPEIIAEISCNHGGSVTQAASLIEASIMAGADAVKIQVWDRDRMVVDRSLQINGGTWDGQNMAALYDQAHTPWDWIPMLIAASRMANVPARFIASVFDVQSLQECEKYNGVDAYKIASFELVDLPLIEAVAKTGKPMIMSTGMATYEEMVHAVTVARRAGCQDLTLLHCTSAYPAPASSAGLLKMQTMQKNFGCPVGLSDHTLGNGVAIAAAVLGAAMIEKHIIMHRSDGGPDATFSMEISELREMVREIDRATQACSNPPYQPGQDPNEEPQRKLRRSLYWAKDIAMGETVTKEHLMTARPANGRPPADIAFLVGMLASEPHKQHTPVQTI